MLCEFKSHYFYILFIRMKGSSISTKKEFRIANRILKVQRLIYIVYSIRVPKVQYSWTSDLDNQIFHRTKGSMSLEANPCDNMICIYPTDNSHIVFEVSSMVKLMLAATQLERKRYKTQD